MIDYFLQKDCTSDLILLSKYIRGLIISSKQNIVL